MNYIEQFKEEFSRLLAEARSKNEFQFVNVLLGYKGIGDLFSLTHFYESDDLFAEFPKLMIGDYSDKNTVRLGLFLYCHFFEMDELYRIIGNLVNIVNGGSFQPFLFDDIDEDDLYPKDKIEEIRNIAVQCGFEPLIECFDMIYSSQLRNSFFHSNYSISEGNYINTSRKHEIKIGGKIKYNISIKEDLAPLLSGTLEFARHFFDELNAVKMSYQNNKLIVGDLSGPEPIAILGDAEKGLIGWESSSGSAIKFTDVSGTPYLGAWNIRFNTPSRVTKRLTKRLTELVDKDIYTINDPVLLQLEAEILAHHDAELKKELAIPFYNWANNTVTLARRSKNPREHEALLKKALERYDKALVHNPAFSPAMYNRLLTGKEIGDLSGTEPNYLVLFNKTKEIWEKDQASVDVINSAGNFSYQAGLRAGDKDEAAALLKESVVFYQLLVKQEPNDCDGQYRLAHSLWKLITKLEDQDPVRPALLGETQTAFRQSLKCSAHNTDYVKSYASFLEYYAEIDQENGIPLLEEAIQALTVTIDATPNAPELYYKRGSKLLIQLRYRDGNEDEKKVLLAAKADFETAINSSSNPQSYLNNYGVALLHLGKLNGGQEGEEYLKKAIDIMDSIIKDHPEELKPYLNKSNAFIGLYDISGNEDDLSAAYELARIAEKLSRNSADFLFEDIASRKK